MTPCWRAEAEAEGFEATHQGRRGLSPLVRSRRSVSDLGPDGDAPSGRILR